MSTVCSNPNTVKPDKDQLANVVAMNPGIDPEILEAEAQMTMRNSAREAVLDMSTPNKPRLEVEQLVYVKGKKSVPGYVEIVGAEQVGPDDYKVYHKLQNGETGMFARVNSEGLRKVGSELKIAYAKHNMQKILDRFIPERRLGNVDGMSSAEIDRQFLDGNTLTDTVHNIQLEMQKADQEALGGDWDAEHSAHLKGVVTEIQNMSKLIADMRLTTTASAVSSVLEPMGEFNGTASNPDEMIRIVRGSLGEETRNRFTMSNEEAMTHELVHAALDWIFNTHNVAAGEHLKLQMRDLYSHARKVITVEDFMPEFGGVYTKIEKQKAQERYDYIFGKEDGVHTKQEADVRLQEFMAYAMTNKAFGKALDSKKPAEVLKEKIGKENLIDWIARQISNMFRLLVSSTRRIKGDTVLEEATKLIYQLTAVQDRYGSKAAARQGMPIDEVIMNKINSVTDKLDSVAQKPVDYILEKTIGEDSGTKTPNSKHTKEEWDEIVNEEPILQEMRDNKDSDIHQTMYNSPFIREWIAEAVDAKRRMAAVKYAAKLGEDLVKFAPKQDDNWLAKMWKITNTLRAIRHMNKVMKRTLNNEGLANLQSKVLQDMHIGEGSIAADLMADFMAGRKTLVTVADMTMQFRAHIDRLRDHNYKGALDDIVNMFTKVDINARKSKVHREALESAALSTDLQAVAVELSKEELIGLLDGSGKLDEAIDKVEAKLGKSNEYLAGEWMRMAKQAAQFMNTGVGLRTNARRIVNLYGTAEAYYGGIDNDYVEYEGDIDKLMTLYALRDANGKEELAELVRLDYDGVIGYLQTAKGMIVSTKEEMEINGEWQEFTKGQANDKQHKNKDLQMAPTRDRHKMAALGYKELRVIETDDNDIDTTSYTLYYSTNTGIGKRVDGAVSLQRRSIPGLTLREKIRMSNPHLTDKALLSTEKRAIKAASDRIRNNPNASKMLMHPVVNSYGQVTDYRYTVPKEDMIRRVDLSVDGVDKLGRSFGQVGTMSITNKQNRKLIDILIDDGKGRNDGPSMWENNAHLYIKVQPKEYDMTDADRQKLYEDGKSDLEDKGKYGLKTEGEEMWGLLPPDARDYLIKRNKIEDWNNMDIMDRPYSYAEMKPRKELYVRKDLVKQLFAYNEPSIVDAQGLFKQKLPPKIERQVRTGEGYFKGMVSLLKSNVVVKMPSTITGNIFSNAKFLIYAGMSPRKAVDYLWLSRKSLAQWKKDEKQLLHYQRTIPGLPVSKQGVMRRELAELEARMGDNPIKPLVDKGLYQSIVEDVATIEDNNPVTNAIESATEPFAPKGSLLHTAVQTAFMTNRSALGRTMTTITQESDFHFRSATYWHGLAEGRNEEEVMREVTDNFINYSKVISSKFVQWLDRMGPEAFYKYWANIQRVQIQRLRKNAFKVSMDWTAQWLGLSPDAGIFHSNMFVSLGRRLSPIDSLTNLFSGGTNIPIFNFLGK